MAIIDVVVLTMALVFIKVLILSRKHIRFLPSSLFPRHEWKESLETSSMVRCRKKIAE